MTQKVLKVGTSAAVTIPKKSLDELGIKIGDDVIVKIMKKSVVIKPQSRILNGDEKIAKLTLNFINRYRKDLKALAKE